MIFQWELKFRVSPHCFIKTRQFHEKLKFSVFLCGICSKCNIISLFLNFLSTCTNLIWKYTYLECFGGTWNSVTSKALHWRDQFSVKYVSDHRTVGFRFALDHNLSSNFCWWTLWHGSWIAVWRWGRTARGCV